MPVARLAALPVVNVRVEDAQAYCIRARGRLSGWAEWERAAAGALARVTDHPAGAPTGWRRWPGNVAEWVCVGGSFHLV